MDAPLDAPDDGQQQEARVSAPSVRLPKVNLSGLTRDGALLVAFGVMAAIIIVGGFLRLTYGNWDRAIGAEGQPPTTSGHLHPDERFLTQISVDTTAPTGNIFDKITTYFDTDESPLNPYNITRPDGSTQTTYVYGTLPLFLNKAVAANATLPYDALEIINMGDPVNSALSTLTGGRVGLPEDDFTTYDRYNLSGRWVSAMIDLLAIVFIFLLGRQLANRNVGLLAAALYAFTPFALQNSHYFIVDPHVTLFATMTLYFAVKGAKHGGYHNFMLGGASAGLAMASKTTALALLPVVVLSVGIYAWGGIAPFVAPLWAGDKPEYAARRDGHKLDRSAMVLVLGTLAGLLAAFIAYRLTMPYAFNTPSLADLTSWKFGSIGPLPFVYPDVMNQHWLDDIQNQEELLSGGSFPPNVQWIGRSRWLWPLQQMISWGMGPALGITAWLGVVFAAIYAFKQKQAAWLIPLAWVVGYFGFMGMQFSLYMRYFLPLYPALCVFAAFLLYHAWRWASSGEPLAALGKFGERISPIKPAIPVLVKSGVVIVVVFTVIAGLAFYNIYRSPVTRAEASCWMFENLPQGSVIGHEHWDDTVPYGQPGCAGGTYEHVEFANFGNDTPEKVEQLLADINSVDYFAPASARLSGTISRVPAVYPVTARFYDTLATNPESIGFKKIAEFNSYPSIFGREFNDTGAEESFSVYDHPTVVVYEKTEDYSAEATRKALDADAFIAACAAQPKDAGQNCIMYEPEILAAQKAGGTWSDIFDAGSPTNRFPALFFVLTMQIAAFAVLPLTLILFRGLPDRGYLLSKPLGIIGLAYLVYAPAGFGVFDFTRGSIAGILALMVLAGVLAAFRWRDELIAWFREHWRFALACEAIFLAAFLFSYWIRLQNPDLYHPFTGGEKPMDFTYFNGVLRTTDLTQGPVDPWYAGGYLNYYWWGFFIGATPVKLLGIVPEVAYNLVVPMFFALSAAATFSVAYNLSEGTRQLMRRRPGGLPISPAGPILAGLLAIFFVMVAGNLKAIGVLEDNFASVSPWNPDIPIIGSVVVIFGGLYESAFGDASFRDLVYGYDWWAPSRALTIIPGQENTVTPITEFPFWTYLFADLHAHLMAIPFSMTVTGVALGVVFNFTRLNPATDESKRRSREWVSWGIVLVLGVVVGSLRWINSWDYPPFMLIAAAGLILGERAKEGRWTLRALTMGVVKAGVMGILSFVLYSVVAKNYSQSYSSINQADQTTDLTDFLSHFGVFLVIITGFLLFQLNRAITRTQEVRWLVAGNQRRRSAVRTLPVMLALILAGWLIITLFTVPRWGVTGVAFVGLITLLLVALHEIKSHTPTAPIMLFVYAMIGLGFGLVGGVEMVTLEGDVGRMNTVFKFYLHVWMMWGVVSAFGLWYILGVMRPQEVFFNRGSEANRMAVLIPRYAFVTIVVLLMVGTLVYPYFGTRARIHERFDPGLGTGNDGLAWMNSENIREGGEGNMYITEYDATGIRGEHEMKYTLDAINWARQNIDGTPTIIEAIGPSYRSLGSRFAINTGLPTVHGWGFHQSQQRVKFAQALQLRQADVDEFYTTTDLGRAREILDKYEVGIVIVGDEEGFNYGDTGMEKFEDGLGGAMELLYENPSNQIWRVIPEEVRGTEIITSSDSETP